MTENTALLIAVGVAVCLGLLTYLTSTQHTRLQALEAAETLECGQ